jgi:glycosyltransferase involved in cell wall biosynthesis
MDKPFYDGLIEKLDIRKWVKMIGPVGHDETLDYYRKADIFCLPAIQDSSPQVILEAMASSLPVVSTKLMGIPEFIVNGESGVLVEPGNVQELSETLLQLLENEKRCRELSASSRKRIEQYFTWDYHVDRLVEIYREVMPSAGH